MSAETEALTRLTLTLDQLTIAMGDMQSATSGATIEIDKNGEITRRTNLLEAEYEEQKKKYLRENTFNQLGNSFKTLTATVLSTEAGFAKYNNAIGQAGGALSNLAAQSGKWGKIIAFGIDASTKLFQAWGTQADNLLKASDSISKLGAANSFSTEEIKKMGRGAGLMSYELDKFIKPLQSMSGGLAMLGPTSADGVVQFSKMTNVLKETRQEFQRLGLNDEERIQAQANFVGMMARTGSVMSGSLKTQDGLQKASLEYTKNLYELAAITGTDLEEARKQQEINRANYEWKLQENKWARDIEKAKARGDEATVQRIEKEKAAANKLIDAVGTLGDPGKTAAVMQQYVTGAVTPLSSQFAILGMNVQQYINETKRGVDVSGKFVDSYQDHAQGWLDTMGPTLGLNEDLRKTTGLIDGTLTAQNKRLGIDEVGARKDAADAIKRNAEGKGAVAEDEAQKIRNALTEAERTAKGVVDDAVHSTNALLHGFNALTVSALVAAGALGLASLRGLVGGGAKLAAGAAGAGAAGAEGAAVAGAAAAAKAAKLAKFAKFAGKGVIGLGTAADLYSRHAEGQSKTQMALGAGGSVAGGIIGGALGTLIPIPVVGTLVGSYLGTMAGGWLADKAYEVATDKGAAGKDPAQKIQDQAKTEEDAMAAYAEQLASATKSLGSLTIGFTKMNQLVDKNNQYNQDIVDLNERLSGTGLKAVTPNVVQDASGNLRSVAGMDIPGYKGGGRRGGGGASAPAFTGTNKEFYDKMYTTLFAEAKKAGVANPDAIAKLGAAQSAQETGYGKHLAGGGNYFGIKGGSGSGVSTQEWDPKLGKMVTIKDNFRKYGSMEASAADYIAFLQKNKRYRGVLGSQSAGEAISAQGETGYASDPNYAAKLAAIHQVYGNNIAAPTSAKGVSVTPHPTSLSEDVASYIENTFNTKDTIGSNAEELAALGEKLDTMIDLLKDSNGLQEKIKQNTST